MEMITSLPPELEARLPEIRDEWLAIGLSTAPALKEQAKQGIGLAYVAGGFQPPKYIIWVKGPEEGIIASAIISGELSQEQIESHPAAKSILQYLKDQVKEQGNMQADDDPKFICPLPEDNTKSFESIVRNNIYTCCYGQQDVGWLSFYDCFRELVPKTEQLNGLWTVARSAGWFWPTEEICLISDRPEKIVMQDDVLHCVDGPALRYRDGCEIYALQGVRVPAQWIKEPGFLTPEKALKEENTERRRVACEYLGWVNVLKHPSLNPVVIDKDEPHIGELIQVDLPDAPKQWFIKFTCGTGREFCEAVNDKTFNTALKANAGGAGWREGMCDPQTFIPFIRT